MVKLAEKKNYVLCVVHTSEEVPAEGRDVSIFTESGVEEATTTNKELLERHLNSVIEVIKIAQRKGMSVVYVIPEGGKGDQESKLRRFLAFVRQRGVNTDTIIASYAFPTEIGAWLVHFSPMYKQKLSNMEVIFAGHFGNICILKPVEYLRGHTAWRHCTTCSAMEGPYIMKGASVFYDRRWRVFPVSKTIERFGGMDKLITIDQLKNL